MVRYLAGELRIAAHEVDRTLRAFDDYLETRRGDAEIDLGRLVRWVVERTMLPGGQVERTITAMLTLAAKLDEALGPPDAGDRRRADAEGGGPGGPGP